MHHRLWKLAVNFNNLVLHKKIQYAFDHDDLYGNISLAFWGVIIEDKENLSGPALLEVILTVHLENFYFSSIVLFLLELFRQPLFIPSGRTKGNQVTVGHYEERVQSSTNESASKYRDFTVAASKTLVPGGKLENLMYILWGITGFKPPCCRRRPC